MNRIDLYHKTVDILYQAYFNDTLVHGNQCGCAVGNIVAANMGLTFTGKDDKTEWLEIDVNHTWYNAISYGVVTEDEITPGIRKQIRSTGYSALELAKIEYAFEDARDKSDRSGKEADMFNGLVAVLDTLKEIHEITDEESIVKFRKHYETKKVTV